MGRALILSLAFIVITGFRAPETKVNWVTLAEAIELAKSNNKPIFIDFTAEWCGWCKVMDQKTFTQPDVVAFMNNNFITVKLDYDSKEKLDFFGDSMTAREIADLYKVPGLPTILLLSHDSKKSKKLVGYKKPEPFLKGLRSFVP